MNINNIWRLNTEAETMELIVKWEMSGHENEILAFILSKYIENIDMSDIDKNDEESKQFLEKVNKLFQGINANLRALTVSRDAMEELGFIDFNTINKH